MKILMYFLLELLVFENVINVKNVDLVLILNYFKIFSEIIKSYMPEVLKRNVGILL